MKQKIMIVCLALLTLTAYGQEEVKQNKSQKSEIIKENKQVEEGKKVLNEIKEDLNESLELKVLRSDKDLESRISAASHAFDVGEDRLDFIRSEENEIKKFEKEAGIKNKNIFLAQQFDEVHKTFNENKNKAESLMKENEKLNVYIEKLNEMENQIK